MGERISYLIIPVSAMVVELRLRMIHLRDINRIHEICSLIEEIWMTVPDQRFGQFLCNLDLFNKRDSLSFFQEDDETLSRLKDVAEKSKL